MQWPLSLDLFQVDNSGQTPLHMACNAENAKALIGVGFSVNAQDEDGYTPLHVAASRANSELVMLLALLSDLNLVCTSSFLFSQNLAMAT